MEDVRKVALLAFAVIVGGFLLSFVLYFGSLLAYMRFPEWFGSHGEFYRTCKSLSPGMTIDQARITMGRYVETGRRSNLAGPPTAGFVGASLPGKPDARRKGEARIVFIPDAEDVADWCVVYPEKGRVLRVVVAPD